MVDHIRYVYFQEPSKYFMGVSGKRDLCILAIKLYTENIIIFPEPSRNLLGASRAARKHNVTKNTNATNTRLLKGGGRTHHIYIYTYIYREKEREREKKYICRFYVDVISFSLCIFIHLFI